MVLDFVPLPFSEWQKWYATTLQWHIVDIVNYIFGYILTSKIYFFIVYILGIFAGLSIGKSIASLLKVTDSSQTLVIKAVNILFCCVTLGPTSVW